MKKLSNKKVELLKCYWKMMENQELVFYKKISDIEKLMCQDKDLGIKDLEFIWVDGSIVGIGNYSRTINLIQGGDLNENLNGQSTRSTV